MVKGFAAPCIGAHCTFDVIVTSNVDVTMTSLVNLPVFTVDNCHNHHEQVKHLQVLVDLECKANLLASIVNKPPPGAAEQRAALS